MKDIIIFDLDGTLAESKTPPKSDTILKLIELIDSGKRVAVISGCSFHQMENQFGELLYKKAKCRQDYADLLSKVYLMPVSGAELYIFNEFVKGWNQQYNNNLTLREKVKIYNAWSKSCEKVGLFLSGKSYGEVSEDRGSQVTFSMCGQEAPLSVKQIWDPKGIKRKKIVKEMSKELEEYEICIGGTTSIDVTKKGIDKAYGLNKLMETINLVKNDILFVGDALFPGGNDYPVFRMGVQCVSTKGPEDTIEIINNILEKKA